MTSTMCVVPECFVPGRHAKECLERPGLVRCDGCLPSLAGNGLIICGLHHEWAVYDLRRLPELYDDLEEALHPYRSPQAPRVEGGRTASSSDVEVDESDDESVESLALTEPGLAWMRGAAASGLRESPSAFDPAVSAMKDDVLSGLHGLCAFVAGEQDLTMPAGDVPSMVAFLDRHASWLSRHPYKAPTWPGLVADLAHRSDRLRARRPAVGLYLGACPLTRSENGEPVDCGGAIRYDRDAAAQARDARPPVPYLIRCPRCGQRDTFTWWQQKIAHDVTVPALLPAVRLAMLLDDSLAPFLAAEGRAITPTTVGKWKWRGKIATVACDLVTKRELYDRADVEAYAREWLGIGEAS